MYPTRCDGVYIPDNGVAVKPLFRFDNTFTPSHNCTNPFVVNHNIVVATHALLVQRVAFPLLRPALY